MSDKQYTEFVREFLGNALAGRPFNKTVHEEVLKLYPPGQDNRKAASALIADATFVRGAKAVVQHTKSSWLYHFNYGAPKPVIHSAELTYVFENGKLNAAGEKLATTMGSFWTSLATAG